MDPEPGVWTKYRIVIDGTKARLSVHGAAQPRLTSAMNFVDGFSNKNRFYECATIRPSGCER